MLAIGWLVFRRAQGSILRLPVTMMTAIEFEGVSKSFGHHGGRALLRQRLLHWARSSGGDRFYA